MNALPRSAVTLTAVEMVAVLVAVTAASADKRPPSPFASAPFAWNPCQQAFDDDAGSRLGWFFDGTWVPSELVACSSEQVQRCISRWTEDRDGTSFDHHLAMVEIFSEGEADEL